MDHILKSVVGTGCKKKEVIFTQEKPLLIRNANMCVQMHVPNSRAFNLSTNVWEAPSLWSYFVSDYLASFVNTGTSKSININNHSFHYIFKKHQFLKKEKNLCFCDLSPISIITFSYHTSVVFVTFSPLYLLHNLQFSVSLSLRQILHFTPKRGAKTTMLSISRPSGCKRR